MAEPRLRYKKYGGLKYRSGALATTKKSANEKAKHQRKYGNNARVHKLPKSKLGSPGLQGAKYIVYVKRRK